MRPGKKKPGTMRGKMKAKMAPGPAVEKMAHMSGKVHSRKRKRS